MNTRSPLDASLSPKASPLVPQVKTASMMQYLIQGMGANPLLSAGIGATTAGLASRYAPGVVGRTIRSAPLTVTAAPAIPLGVAGAAGAYGGRFLARNPRGLATVAGATGTAAVYPHLATPSGITNAFNSAVESTKGLYRDTTGAIGRGYDATTGAIGTGFNAMVENPMYTAGGLALASLANRGVRSAAGSALGAAGKAITRPGVPRRAAMGAAGVGGLAGSGKLLAPTIGSAGYGGAAEALKGLTSSDLAGLGLGGAALGVLAAQPVRSGLSAAVRGAASGTGAASLGTARYLGSRGLTPASLRAALTTGAGLGAGKYLSSPVVAEVAEGAARAAAPAATDAGYIANALSGLTPLQIGLASAASGAGRYLYPAVRPRAATYMRRRRELAALERLERARAADPREQLKRFLFGAPKEGSYGVSPLHAPLTKTAGSLLDYPGMDKEAFIFAGRAVRGLSNLSRGLGTKLRGRASTPLSQAPQAKNLTATQGPNFQQLASTQQSDVLSGVGSNRAAGGGFFGRMRSGLGDAGRRIKSRYYQGLGQERRLEIAARARAGGGSANLQQRLQGVENNQEITTALANRAQVLQDRAQAAAVPRMQQRLQQAPTTSYNLQSAPLHQGGGSSALRAPTRGLPASQRPTTYVASGSGQQMTRDSYISGNIDIGAGPQVDLFSQQGFSGPEVARKLEEILVRNTTKVRSNPRGAVSSEFRAYLSANPEFRNLSPKQQQNAVETLLKRRFSGVTSLDHLSARISGQAGTANQFNTEVSNLADSAIATTVAAAAAKGNTAAADDVVKALANELQANTAMQSYGVTEGAQAEVLARNILEQRAATLGGAPAGAKGDLGGYLSRLDPKQITGGRPAGLTGQERAIEQQLQRVGTEARTAVKNQQASGAGQYTVTSRQLDEATQAGGSLDQIGVRVRGDVLDNSKLLQNVGNLDDMAGAVSPTVRNEALLNARTAVSAEINRVNAEIGEEIARAVNANGGDGAAVLNQINRSGGLREVGDVIAAGGVGGRAVNEANLAQQLTGIGVEAQLANELAAPGSAVFDRISTLTSEAASNASKSVNAVRNSLAEAGGGLLGSRTTGAMNRVNQQLTTQISTIGDDAAALAQENMRLLQQSMPRNAQGQTAALGLIDDLGEGLARGDTTAVKTFNDAVANLRSGSPVTYTEAVTSRAGTVTRQTRDIKLDGDDLRNFQQGYGSLRGATPESVNQLRTQVSKNPVQLIDNPNMSSALDNVTGSTAARDLVRNNGDIAGKLINNQTLSLNERAKLISDAGQTASLSPQQQTMLSTLARGQKLAKNTDSNDIAALETAINNELQNVPGYSQLRNLDMARLFEEASSNQRAFEAYVAAPTAPQRGFVDRLRTVAAAGAPPDPRATNYMAAPLSAGVMGGGAYAANATASYGMSALTAPVKGRYTKTAVALEEEALSDPGMSPMEPPVFQPPSPKGDMAALLSMGVLGVGTSEKSSSFMAAPVLSRPAV